VESRCRGFGQRRANARERRELLADPKRHLLRIWRLVVPARLAPDLPAVGMPLRTVLISKRIGGAVAQGYRHGAKKR
jgi:hypothetical protein